MKKGILNRDLTYDGEGCCLTGEKGTIVFEYIDNTYGLITDGGIPISLEAGEGPFIQIPGNAVDWEKP